MQDTAAGVARILAQRPKSTVGFVDEDQGIRICHNAFTSVTIHLPELIHFDNRSGLSITNKKPG
jgi:hypothetical protein